MSLDQFQQALADLVASPEQCRAARIEPEILEQYGLTQRERDRILAMVRHPGMSFNCSLYRANRLTPIARSLPETCLRLGDRLRPEMEAFWKVAPEFELQFRTEAERFARFLLDRSTDGDLGDRSLVAVIEEELSNLGSRFRSEHLH